MVEFLSNPELWKYASIPVVAGAVGWFTNWVAVKMTFLPIEPIGPWPPYLGWQGIIPSKARKMASIAVDSTLSKLGTLQEVVDAMEPKRIADHVVSTVAPRIEEQVEELMRQDFPTLWGMLSDDLKSYVVDRVRSQLPEVSERLMRDIAKHVDELMDLKEMVVKELERDKTLLNRMFLECGEPEFRFIILSGLWFGIPFGLVQLGVWIVHPEWWVLPFFGFVVGIATNWIALNIIFRPLEPTRVGPFTIQGLFLRRQAEVATTWCRLVTREVLTIRHISNELLNGPRSRRTRTLIKKHVQPAVGRAAGVVKPLLKQVVGAEGYESLKDRAYEKTLEVSIEPFDDRAFNEDRAVVVERLMRDRMLAMSPAEFQELLRPAFQEDEWKLVLVGGLLGLAAGTAQLVFVFG